MSRNIAAHIAYLSMEVCNPVSLETVDGALGLARLPAGARTLELGCGSGGLAVHLAQRFGLRIDAIERDEETFAAARARVGGCAGPGVVEVHHVDSKDFLRTREPYDLTVCLGASQVALEEGIAAFLSALRETVRPGGFILWGDPMWRGAPSEEIRALANGLFVAEGYRQSILAAEAAGLQVWSAAESSQQEWDQYVWRMVSTVQGWLEDNPSHPDWPEVNRQADGLLKFYLGGFRESLGFGLFLFRRPLA